MIKRIAVKDLMKKDRDFGWEKDKILFLYGENGIGKTTLLDSIYYALTNDNSIFISTRKTGKKEEIPKKYSKLSVEFENESKIEVFGASFFDDKKIIQEHKQKHKKENNQEKIEQEKIKEKLKELKKFIENESNEGFLYFEKIKNFFKNIYGEAYRYGIFISKMPDNINKNAEFHLDIIQKIPDEKSRDNLFSDLNMYYSAFLNERSFIARKNFSKEYEVLYLTVERTAPEIIDDHAYKEIFVKQNKFNLIKSFKIFWKEVRDQIKKLQYEIISVINFSAKEAINNEWKSDENDSENTKLSLDKSKITLFEIISTSLNLEKDVIEKIKAEKEIIKDKKLTNKLVRKINSISDNQLEQIGAMVEFIDDVNDFFHSSNKKIKWENKFSFPKVIDENTDNKSGKPLDEYHFSSGERQIITILFNIHFFKFKKSKLLILADEIEISLSLFWQELLFKKINKMDDVELIGVTHSPFVVTEEEIKNVLKPFESKNDKT